jgi:GNAT superfamily N-acetyltransferase
MTQAFTIRSAALPDAPRIAELSGVLGYPVADDAMALRLQRLLARVEETVLVAALPDGEVIGWLHGSEQDLLESGRRCEIVGLVVHPEHRTCGVGRRLVAAVEAWAGSRGLGEVAVRSNVQRVESHVFYQHLGYARIKTQHVYRKQLLDPQAV